MASWGSAWRACGWTAVELLKDPTCRSHCRSHDQTFWELGKTKDRLVITGSCWIKQTNKLLDQTNKPVIHRLVLFILSASSHLWGPSPAASTFWVASASASGGALGSFCPSTASGRSALGDPGPKKRRSSLCFFLGLRLVAINGDLVVYFVFWFENWVNYCSWMQLVNARLNWLVIVFSQRINGLWYMIYLTNSSTE